MAHLAFYRKYRPKCFQDVIGQQFIVQSLTNAIKLKELTHAYIFAGPKGIGKTTIAKVFAKALNCDAPNNGDACNQCVSCHTIENNETTDILELDAASNNGVEDVRHIIETAQFLPNTLRQKVYIIDEAHMLTPQAWNAMLKTLEEAPRHVIFVFATTEMYKIPGTIISRCQYYVFNRLTNLQLHKMIENVALKEKVSIEDKAINKIVSLADGSGRDALSMLEQLAIYADYQIKLKDVEKMFGLIDLSNKIKLLNLILTHDTKNVLDLLEQYDENGINFSQLANDLSAILIDKLIHLQTQDITLFKHLDEQTVQQINVDQKTCISLINVLQEAFMKMRNSSDARFYLELAIFNSFNLSLNKKENINVESPSPIIHTKTSSVETQTPTINKTESKPIAIIQKTPLEQLFFNIAYNNATSQITNVQSFVNKIKDGMYAKCLSFLVPSSKVMIASKNGAILLFEDEVDAELLNSKQIQFDFLKEINTYFHQPMFFLGLTKEQIRHIGKTFIELKKQGEVFAEPDLAPLKEILKVHNSTEQIALEIFGEE